MNRLSALLRPAAHIARLPEEQAGRLYPKFRWRILESTFIGYATFYVVRNNLPVVSEEMGQALSYSKGQIGDLLAVTAIAYGIGKFLMGAWSDRSNPRYFMPAGLLLTALCSSSTRGTTRTSTTPNSTARSGGWPLSLGHPEWLGRQGGEGPIMGCWMYNQRSRDRQAGNGG